MLLILGQVSYFISRFWKNIYKIFGIKIHFSLIFYLDIDKQSKIANKDIKIMTFLQIC